jgi:hypothetical protein
MKIEAAKQFGIFLYVVKNTERAAEAFPAGADNYIEMDFTGCTIDYPAVSRIIDVAIGRLRLSVPPRTLKVIFNIDYDEPDLIRAFLLGSRLLKLDGSRPTHEQLLETANKSLKELEIAFEIDIIESGNLVKSYRYG